MLELAHQVLALTKSQSEIAHRPLPSDDPTRRRPDISLATKQLGWRPEVVLSEGLERTIAYFSDVLPAGDG